MSMKKIWDEITELKSSDTNVMKYIFKKGDAIAEAVLYRYGTYEKRTVMCISVQSGCPMGCTFCGTGEFFGRDLTHEEILSQVQYMRNVNDIDLLNVESLQIMTMSMGEPLLNVNNVNSVFRAIHCVYPNARLLVSSAAPKTKMWDSFMDMASKIDTVGLQFSVHASNDKERNKIMPMKAKLSLEEIAYKGLEFFQRTGRKPFFNYCVTEENNTEQHAMDLRLLFDPRVWEATLSVVCEADESMDDSTRRQEHTCTQFSADLVYLGYNTRVFNPAGTDDIGGGCGQLWAVQEYAKNNPQHFKQSTGNKIACKNM